MSEKYLVNICRTSYAHHEFEVVADSEEEATKKAMELAGDIEFFEDGVPDYEVENVCTAKEWQKRIDQNRRYHKFQAKLPTGWEIRNFQPEYVDAARPDAAIVHVDSGDREYGVYVCKRKDGTLYIASEHYTTTVADPKCHREMDINGDIEDAMDTIITWARDINLTGYPK